MHRFHVLVLNYGRTHSFFNNFHKIRNFRPETDILTVLSCSPSQEEIDQIRRFESETNIPVRYFTRRNFGIDQAARLEYFTGKIEPMTKVLDARYTFHMQEHYLDTDSEFSRWSQEDGRVKGDVIPDDAELDLDALSATLDEHQVDAAFCDRTNPCWFRHKGQTRIAPNGGNFLFRSSLLGSVKLQRRMARVLSCCDNSYLWAVYAEYKWGEFFFQEGMTYYDIKRRRTFTSFQKEDFYDFQYDWQSLFYHFEERKKLRNVFRRMSGFVKRTSGFAQFL